MVQGSIIRKDWLDELGLAVPETLDEWHTVLTAFKEKKGAEAPLCYQYSMLGSGEFVGAFGITRGFTVENGKVVLGRLILGYKDFLSTFASGIRRVSLTPISQTWTPRRWMPISSMTRPARPLALRAAAWASGCRPCRRKIQTRAGAGAPCGGRKGEIPKIGQRDFPYTSSGSAAITSSCKNVELAARFLDYGYSEAGNTLYNSALKARALTWWTAIRPIRIS